MKPIMADAPPTAEAIEQRARALYDACTTVKPAWDQLGDITRSVWRERVTDHAASAPAHPQQTAAAPAGQLSLL